MSWALKALRQLRLWPTYHFGGEASWGAIKFNYWLMEGVSGNNMVFCRSRTKMQFTSNGEMGCPCKSDAISLYIMAETPLTHWSCRISNLPPSLGWLQLTTAMHVVNLRSTLFQVKGWRVRLAVSARIFYNIKISTLPSLKGDKK